MNKMLSRIGAISLALVAAAVFAAGAQADRPDDRAGVLGVGGVVAGEAAKTGSSALAESSVVAPDLIERAVARNKAQGPVRPDDHGGPRWPVAIDGPTLVSVPGDSFQWRDATLGAAATAGLLLVAAGLALTLRHRRRVALP